jgi:hypothetical protein
LKHYLFSRLSHFNWILLSQGTREKKEQDLIFATIAVFGESKLFSQSFISLYQNQIKTSK